MKIKIEKDIPISKVERPSAKLKRRWRRSKYPFDKMEIDNSFFLKATEKVPARKLCMRLSSAAYHYVRRKKLDSQFTVRSVITDEAKGVRVWRIK